PEHAAQPPLDDPVYRKVMALRAARALHSNASPFQVVQTHYKPFARARLVAEARCKPPETLYIDLRAQEMGDEPAAYNAFPALEGVHAWPLHSGPGLETVHFCFDAHEFARFLDEHHLAAGEAPLPRLLRYVPRKRALFRHDVKVRSYIKCYERGRDHEAANNIALLEHARPLPFNTPRLIAYDRHRRALVMSEVPGVPLTALLDHASPRVFASVGRALAALHRSDLTPQARWTIDRLVAALDKAMRDVKLALPWVGEQLDERLTLIAERRTQLAFDEQTPIHGNLFGDQILIDSDRVGIVDWDDFGIGDPLHDIGRLAAHVMFALRRPAQCRKHFDAMLAAYAEDTGRAVTMKRLR
ncbi:MAG: phosphotransferase family protein, partial [Burkholderiales bacterium]